MKIILLSSERSGSNLLRLMLNIHPEISAPTAPHIVKNIAPYVYLYGNLNDISNSKQLIKDILKLTQVFIEPWQTRIDIDEVLQYSNQRSFWSFFNAVYDLNKFKSNKKHWFCKENNLFDYAFEILYFLDNVKFIYLVRDGRDVASSMRKMPSGNYHYFFLAQKWKEEQSKCLRIYNQLKDANLIKLIRYEQLLENPEYILKDLCNFLEVEYSSLMLEFYKQNSAKDIAYKSNFWKNLSKPLMTNNSNNFRKEMSQKEIKLFESVAGSHLKYLGYDCNYYPELITNTTLIKQILYKAQDYCLSYLNKSKYYKEPRRKERENFLKNLKENLIKNLSNIE